MRTASTPDCESIHHDVRRYLNDCFARECVPRATEAAEFLGRRREDLTRHFSACAEQTLSAYLKAQQLEQAKELLRFTDLRTAIVAYRSGFGTRRSFFRAFQKATGISPAVYRNKHKMSLDDKIGGSVESDT